VLLGDMSLVGPRPHVANMKAGGTAYETLVPYYFLRVQMRPGLTGWAQANGLRGPTVDAQAAIDRVDHDIAYVQNFSLWLDLLTLLRTVRRELTGGTGL
jgi:lipopolysaccharide/colanic/teichoic acid biosynthesis glycosyltransferase